MTDVLTDLHQGLARQLDEGRKYRDELWTRYWEGRRMVTVPDNVVNDDVTGTGPARLFPSFPNLAPKDRPIIISKSNSHYDPMEIPRSYRVPDWCEPKIRDCIARLKSARAKESTNRNLSTLLAVVVKVQKDLETLVGDDWKQSDAAVESQVTRDDRSL